MTKREIAEVLDEIAFLLELKGENPYKVRAYAAGADAIRDLTEEPADLVRKGELRKVPGIGEALSAVITELCVSGKCRLHDELKAEYPATLIELAGVPGIGTKKIKTLYETLGVASLGELEYACIENRLVGLKGFGQKTQEKILAGIRQHKRRQGFHLYAKVLEEADRVLDALRQAPGVTKADMAGEVRRRCEVVQSLFYVAAGGSPDAIVGALQKVSDQVEYHPEHQTVTALSLRGLPISVTLAEPGAYGWAWFQATGNAEHVEAVIRRINGRVGAGGASAGPPSATEEAVYAAAGLPFIPPELREGHGELTSTHGAPPKLVEAQEVQGIFHNHTLYSDGSESVETMVKEARALGYQYIGISDHSQSAFYANGLKEDRIRAQHAEIDEVQKKFPDIRIFKGIEADILVDGAMDYPDEILATFDFVIASVHSHFNLPEGEQTRRICRALANPYVTMLGHATGRLLLSRDPYKVDMHTVIETAAEHRKVIEINANPHRLDMDWRLCGYAKERGITFSINPDAHSIRELGNVPFGVNMARKGALSAADIVNTLSADAMASKLQSMRPST